MGNESLSGKTVVARLDLNSNVENSELFPGARIREHAKTLKQLSEKGAKVVALAHQGRKGEEGCISLQQHAEEISEQVEKEVKLLKWDSDYIAAIKEMQNGDIVLMENVRFHDNEEQEFTPEEASKIEWVQKIASAADIFVQDSLSVCHRAQPSVIGFSGLPSFAGPVLERELKALEHYDSAGKPAVFIFGGAKVKDSIKALQAVLENGKADFACAAGLVGELFLKAKGIRLGEKEKVFEEKGLNELLGSAKQILEAHPEKLVLPQDVAVLDEDDERLEIAVEELPSDFLVCDVGMETVSLFRKHVLKAKLVVFNGPLGMFEKYGFEVATRKLLSEISKAKAYSLIGGGDTVDAVEELDFSFKDFSHVSLGGKALMQYISGKELPGLLALSK
ncbi:MAG: phosphoglycerate kinase [Candidatus Diapherotrites archaeon]|uniref:Phosphoglycerate kinase n=1 Tax=Candidatus Iainarchaeum sp. TaxID=3101447 RepID=A0A938YXF6_9ARCH|nr:phosphoglycerate kinase [Candidatus Diapherotrites archaeon]